MTSKAKITKYLFFQRFFVMTIIIDKNWFVYNYMEFRDILSTSETNKIEPVKTSND